jgi:hypothetical protein
MGNEKVDARLKVSQAHQCAYRTAVLRLALLEQLGGHDAVQWGHNWSILRKQREGVELSFGRWRGQECQGRSCSWSRWYSQFSAEDTDW